MFKALTIQLDINFHIYYRESCPDYLEKHPVNEENLPKVFSLR
jgi:hypothetical protein